MPSTRCNGCTEVFASQASQLPHRPALTQVYLGPETTSIWPGLSAWPTRGFQRLRCCISTLKRLATMYSESPCLTLYWVCFLVLAATRVLVRPLPRLLVSCMTRVWPTLRSLPVSLFQRCRSLTSTLWAL